MLLPSSGMRNGSSVTGSIRAPALVWGALSMTFLRYRDNFDPESLAQLETTFNDVWTVLQHNGQFFDQKKTRTAIADLIIRFAAQGETDPARLKALALAALPSHPSSGDASDDT